jgi:hypothetical protein
MFCGAQSLQIYRGHLPNLRTLVWAPLVLWSIDGWIDSSRVRWTLVGMAAVALQLLAGHIQEVYYTGIVAAGYALLLGLGRRQVVRALGGLGAIYLGGASLAAVQLLPGIDAARETVRSGLTYEVASTYAFPPENLLTLVLPGIFGDIVTTPYWGRWTLTEMCLFIGVAPFLFAVYGARHGARAERRYSLVLAVAVLILACGSYTPLYRFLYAYVPAFGNFRGTTKFAFLATLFVVMLAAVGLDQALRDRALPRWPGALAGMAGGVLLGVGAAVWGSVAAGDGAWWARFLTAIGSSIGPFHEPVEWGPPFFMQAGRHTAIVLAIGGATFLVAAAFWQTARRRRGALYALVLLGVAEVFTYARYSRPTFDPGPRLRASDQLRRFLAQSPGDYRVLGFDPYVAMSSGASDVYGYDPMLLARYGEFLAAAYGRTDPERLIIITRLERAAPLLGMLRLRYVIDIAQRGVHAQVAKLQVARLEELPRAFLVTRWRLIADSAARLAALKEPTFDPRTTVLLETAPDPAPDPAPDAAAASVGSVHVVDLSTDALEIDADLTAPAVLVLSDSYSVGWKATPLGAGPQRAYTVLPADHTLRAIPLAAGRHHVRLEYRPTAFVVGAWLTVVALLAYTVAIGSLWRRRASAKHPRLEVGPAASDLL